MPQPQRANVSNLWSLFQEALRSRKHLGQRRGIQPSVLPESKGILGRIWDPVYKMTCFSALPKINTTQMLSELLPRRAKGPKLLLMLVHPRGPPGYGNHRALDGTVGSEG